MCRISIRKTILSGALWLILAIALLPMPLHALSPAGAVIFMQAKGSYFDTATGLGTEASSNSVAVSVLQVASVSGGKAGPAFAPQGQQIRFPHIITNTGNGIDTLRLAFSVSGAFIPQQIALYDDPNGNGIVDPGETQITFLKEMGMNESRAVVVLAEIPQTALPTQKASITITVHSTVNPLMSDTINDTIEVSHEASVVLSLSSVPTGLVTADGMIEYTLKTTNAGLSNAEPVDTPVLTGSVHGEGGTLTTLHGVFLSLPIPANTVFVSAVADAPKDEILVYQKDGVWVDSEPPPLTRGRVREVGMIVLANGGTLLPNQVTLMKLKVVVLPWVSKTTIHLVGKIFYNDHDPTTGVITTNSNEATVFNDNLDGVFFTNEVGTKVTFYRPGQTIFVRAVASSLNRVSSIAETLGNVLITSDISGDEEVIEIVESGENTGIFLAAIPFIKEPDRDKAGFIKPVGMSNVVWQVDPKETNGPSANVPIKNNAEKTFAMPDNAKLELVSNALLHIGFVNPVDQSFVRADVLIDPSGVVFDSITNKVISGVTVMLVDPIHGGAVTGIGTNPVITGADGRFSFDAPPGQYKIAVSAIPPGFSFPSVLPPANLTPAGRTIDPLGSYGQTFTVTTAVAFDIPLDPSNPILFVQKTANKREATIGDQITYTVKIKNTSATLPVLGIHLLDQPAIGITYLLGSATCTPPGGATPTPLADPTHGRPVTFETSCTTPIPNRLEKGEEITITYKAVIGPGATIGDGINRANALGKSILGTAFSNESIAAVKVIPDVFTDRATLIGKVFIDLNGNGNQDEGEPGVPAVRLILEDGTSVITDEDGKYSLYGLKPTTHVLKVDPMTLPPEFILTDTSTRFAGDPHSRFIDLTPGELHKANFTIAPVPKEVWEPIIKGRASPAGIPLPLVAVQTSPSPQDVTTDLKALVAAASPDLTIVSPVDHALIPIRSTNVIITGHSGIDFRLRVNDKPIPDSHAGSIVVSKEKPIAAIEWVAVPLEVGENKIEVTGYDSFGNLRQTKALTLSVPGNMATLKITSEPKTLPADGVSKSTITIRIFDRAGLPVLTRAFLTVNTTKGKLIGEDLNPEMPGHQIAVLNGSATLTLIASENVEDAMITAETGEDRRTIGDLKVSFLPALRKVVAVGILDGKINLRNFKGNIMPVDSADSFQETLTEEGRAAIYLKGKVLGKALLTLSYDSNKDKNERLFRDIQPTAFYPIYGDSSEKKFDAQSTGKLYVKVEQGKSYLLFGDFSPDFTDNTLLSYQRSFNGLKYHYEDETTAGTAFHNRSEQKQVVERIAGNGTSGFYQLTRFPIVENSDLVEIITVDRERPGIILHTESMGRFIDYTLETGTGRILFRSPVLSFDGNFNPIFIKVTYETAGSGIPFDTYGVNGKYKISKQLQVGGTFVQSTEPDNRFTLYGADLRAQIAEGVVASFEVADSDSILGGANANGEGYKVSLSMKPNKAIDATAYWLKTDPAFNNPSANITGGKIEQGLLAHLMVREGTLFGVEAISSKDERAGTKRTTTDFKIEQGLGSARGEIGLKHIEDHTPTQDSTTETLRAKIISPFPYIPRLTTSAEYEEALNRNANIVTLGNDIRLNQTTKLYSKQQWISGGTDAVGTDTGRGGMSENGRRVLTTVGIDSSAMPGTTAFSEYRISQAISGREDQAAIGLRNRYTIKKGVSLSTTLEQTKTVEGPANKDATAFSIGLEHLSSPDLKGTTRYEIRKSAALVSHLGTLSVAYRLTSNLSLLTRETIFAEDGKAGQVDKLSSDLIVGAAFRPVFTDALHLLTKSQFKYESNGVSILRVYTESIETNIAVAPRTALFLKYANRVVQDAGVAPLAGDFHSMTQMVESRVTVDVTEKIDMGLSGRHFWQDRSQSRLWGYGVEGGYRIDRNLWFSVGYEVNGFDDNNTTNDHAFVHGLFIRLRYKFDEGIIDFLKGGAMTLKGEKAVSDCRGALQCARTEAVSAPPPPILLPLLVPSVSYKLAEEEKKPVLVPIPMPEVVMSYRFAKEAAPTVAAIEPVQSEVMVSFTGAQFKFNQSRLTESGKRRVAGHAQLIKQHPDMSIVIEGHTDRVGSASYNYRLGMRRAHAVWKALKQAGVKNKMRVVSYGKTRPIDKTHNTAANAKNRRVEVRTEKP